MSTPLQLPIAATFADNISPLILGTSLVCPLFGVTVTQSIWYFRHYPNDKLLLKCLIATLLLLDGGQTLSMAAATKVAYLRAQVDYDYPFGIILHLYFTTITLAMIQCAYTYRVWIISSRNKYLTSILAFLALYEFVVELGMDAFAQIKHNANDIHQGNIKTFTNFTMGGKVACDILTSASLVYYLNKWRNGIRRTENLVDRLLIYIVGIGLLTNVFVVLMFITYISMPGKLVFMIFYSIISKLYFNSLLVTLNARRGLRLESVAGESVPLSVLDATVEMSTIVAVSVCESSLGPDIGLQSQ